MTTTNTKWIRIISFYFIAIIFSYFFRFSPPEWYDQIYLPYGWSMAKDWISALGPFLGAFIVIIIFKPDRNISFFGSSKFKSILMTAIPLLIFAIIGANNSENINTHFYGFTLGVTIIVYCILEETGWRGYLQDELRDFNPVVKYLIIGSMWYAWHLSFLNDHSSLFNELQILTILILVSWGIGQAVEHTRSIIVAACLHMIGNILAFSSLIKRAIPLDEKIIIISVCVLLWILILVFWERNGIIFRNSKTK